jgi:hypothetical protein
LRWIRSWIRNYLRFRCCCHCYNIKMRNLFIDMELFSMSMSLLVFDCGSMKTNKINSIEVDHIYTCLSSTIHLHYNEQILCEYLKFVLSVCSAKDHHISKAWNGIVLIYFSKDTFFHYNSLFNDRILEGKKMSNTIQIII